MELVKRVLLNTAYGVKWLRMTRVNPTRIQAETWWNRRERRMNSYLLPICRRFGIAASEALSRGSTCKIAPE